MNLFTLATIFLITKLTIQDKNVLRILHLTAFHSKFEPEKTATEDVTNYGIARLAHYVNWAYMESESTIFIDTMDWFTGSIWFSVHKQEICSAFVNLLRIDAIGIGEEEINFGETLEKRTDNFVRYIESISNKTILCANCEMPRTSPLHDIIKKSHVHQTRSGLDVGITAFIRKTLVRPISEKVMTIGDDLSAVKEQVAEMKGKGVKVIIVISHAQWSYLQVMGQNFRDVDFVVGGHSHRLQYNGTTPSGETTMGPYPEEIITKEGKRIMVGYSGTGAHYLGDMTIYFDDDGEVVNFHGTPVWLNHKVEEDEEAKNLLETFRPQVREKRRIVLGTTRVFLNHSCYWQECNLGNFIADGFVDYQASKYSGPSEYWTDMPIAILRGKYLAASIDPQIQSYHNITVAHLLTIMPSSDNIVCLKMNGSVLRQAMEHAVSEPADETSRRFVQVSGLHVVFDMSKNLNERVVSLKARCGNCDIPEYRNVGDEENYNVIMSRRLKKGYAGFDMFKAIPGYTDLGGDIEMIETYIRNHRIVETGGDERIIVLNRDMPTTNAEVSKRRAPHTSGVMKCPISNLSYTSIICTFTLAIFFVLC